MKKIPIINQIIKNKKKELKINQVEFAEILQKALTTIKRYDSGYPIPLDTLKIICDKINLDLKMLVLQQSLENKAHNTNYYIDLIEKFHSSKGQNKIFNQTFETTVKRKISEEILSYIFSAYYLKKQNTIFRIIPKINFFDNKFFIKSSNDKTLNIFTESQATELIEHIEDYIDYFIFKCQKENLTK